MPLSLVAALVICKVWEEACQRIFLLRVGSLNSFHLKGILIVSLNPLSAKFLKIHLEVEWMDLWKLLQLDNLMVGMGEVMPARTSPSPPTVL